VPIKLRFTDEPGIFPKLIKLYSWSNISHVEFVFSDGYLGAFFPDGVKVKPFNYSKPKRAWIGTVDVSDALAKEIEAFARSQIGKKYSLLGIIGFIIKHDFNKRNSYFCSELVLDAFKAANYQLLDLEEVDRVYPAELFASPLIKIEEVI
jgi:uncharacterized protein YycO